MITQFVHAVAPYVAALAAAGVGTWLALILIDTVLGIALRTGNSGTFSWQYVQHFLVSNFATAEAKVMAGLVGSAGINAVVVSITGGHSQLQVVFATFAAASVTAFVGAVASQDVALIADIVTKLRGDSPGQIVRWNREGNAQ